MEENVNGVLFCLKQQLVEESIVTGPDDLHVGDIIYVELDRSDGLVLNQGYDTRLKYVVVAGSKSNKKDYGVVLINSDADYSDENDLTNVMKTIKESDFVEPHFKKVYGINEFLFKI